MPSSTMMPAITMSMTRSFVLEPNRNFMRVASICGSESVAKPDNPHCDESATHL